jgi:hypothetical protein
LVVVRILGGNVCWYPLPYNYGYYDYNAYYYSHYPRRRHGWNNNNHYAGNNGPGGGINPNPSPTPGSGPQAPVITPIRGGRDKINQPPLSDVPPGGVVTVAASEFGRGKGRFGTPPLSVAQNILSKDPTSDQAPVLPTYGELNGRIGREIRTTTPPMVRANADVSTGASTRKPDEPLDQELRKSRIFGGRAPLQINTGQGEVKVPVNSEDSSPRKTGAVERPIIKRDDSNDSPPIRYTPPPKKDDAPVYTPPSKGDDGPVYTPPKDPVRVPRNDPPPVKRNDPPNEPIKAPRYDPPPKREDPPPRYDPPTKRDDPPPRRDPPAKSDPPPSKSEPSKPSESPRRIKDGR